MLVEIEGLNAISAVTSIPTGEYNWVRYWEQTRGYADIDHLVEKLRGGFDWRGAEVA